MRALIAPDKFKGTLSAAEVADAIAAGLSCEYDLCPLADGGEGTAAILLNAVGGEWRPALATDPLGREVECRFALLGDRSTAVVEVAEASGLWRLDPNELDPLGGSSRGTGELLAAAAGAGAEHLLLACGGSATTDGGLAALEVFRPGSADVTCLCDTDVAFGSAAALYSPQKGASPAQVVELGRRLERIAGSLPHDPWKLPYAGAAGGLAGGFWAHGARLVAGARHVLAAVGFDDRMLRCNALITGEGRLDGTSFRGKAVGEVAGRAGEEGIPCHAIVGRDALTVRDAAVPFASVTEAGTPEQISQAAAELRL